MLNRLNIKKEYLLIIGTVLLFILCYRFAFEKTIAAWQLNKQLSRQLAQSTDLSVQPAYLARKSANRSKILELYRTDTLTFRSSAINQISALAQSEHVKLTEVPVIDPAFHSDKFIIEKLAFEGDFFALTRIFNQLEKSHGIGMPRSVIYKLLTFRSKEEQERKLVLEINIEILRN
jgi:hypothetical protein